MHNGFLSFILVCCFYIIYIWVKLKCFPVIFSLIFFIRLFFCRKMKLIQFFYFTFYIFYFFSLFCRYLITLTFSKNTNLKRKQENEKIVSMNKKILVETIKNGILSHWTNSFCHHHWHVGKCKIHFIAAILSEFVLVVP